MKKSRILLLLLVLIYALALFPTTALAASDFPELSAPAAILLHPESGVVLFERQADQKRYPASLTKITTALVVIDAIEAGEIGLDDIVTASTTFESDLEADGSSQGIKPGEQMSVNDLLHCVLIASANEACNILAEYVSGSLSAFVERMNTYVQDLGCTGTHYTNAHGLHNDEHYTTARDIATLATAAMEHAFFMELVETATYTVPATNLLDARTLTNTNMLINGQLDGYYTYEPCLGGKTGRTSKAGNCLMAYAEQDGVLLISVVMGTDYVELPEKGTSAALSFPETRALFRWGFANYGFREVVSTADMVAEATVLGGSDTDFVVVHPAQSVSYFLPNDYDLSVFTTVVRLSSAEGVKAPIQEGQVLGALDLYQSDKYLCSVDVIALNEVRSAKASENKILDEAATDSEPGGETGTAAKSSLSWVKTAVIIFLCVVIVLILLYVVLLILNARRRAARRKRVRK